MKKLGVFFGVGVALLVILLNLLIIKSDASACTVICNDVYGCPGGSRVCANIICQGAPFTCYRAVE